MARLAGNVDLAVHLQRAVAEERVEPLLQQLDARQPGVPQL